MLPCLYGLKETTHLTRGEGQTPNMTSLGTRIKQLRTEKGLSLEKAANALDPQTTGKTLSKWERDIESPQLANFTALALFFDVNADYLLGWSDERTPYPTTGEDAAGGQAAAPSAADDELALEGDARTADPRPTRPRRGSKRRP